MNRIIRKYTCNYCHHDFDGREYEGDDPIIHCPSCEKETAKLINENKEGEK